MSEKKIFLKSFMNRLFLFIIFFYFAILSFSQDYLVHQYTESNGLPGSSVFDMTQDKWGQMWFATRSGIAVYDGFQWENFSLAEGLPVSSFLKIRSDRRGRIWALSSPDYVGLHVVYYEVSRNRKWKTLPPPPTETIRDDEITSFDVIEGKLENQHFIAIGTAHEGVLIWNGKQWEQWTNKSGLFSDTVNDLVGLEGKFYTATNNGLSVLEVKENGDIRVDNRLNAVLHSKIPLKSPIKIKAINVERSDRFEDYPISHHRVWLFGNQWLGYFENGQFNPVCSPPAVNIIANEQPAKIFPDYHNGLYISSSIGNYYFNFKTNKIETIGIKNGLIDEGVRSVFVDFEKNVWIACQRGISKIASRRFSSYRFNHGLLSDEVTAVLEYEPGKYVFGHNIGLTFFDGSNFMRRPLLQGPEGQILRQRVMDIKIDSKKKLWLALNNTYLVKTNIKGEINQYGPEEGLPIFANTIWIDPDDTVWVGTMKGLYIKKNNGFMPLNTGIHGSETLNIRKIYKSPGDDTYYFATVNSGLLEYKNHEWHQYKNHLEPNANNIYAILEDTRGRLLLGTFGGLFVLKNGEIKRFIEDGFKIERSIGFIVEDNSHRFWFGTDRDVIRWDGKKEVKYSTTEGLIGLETNRAASIVDNQGKVWIGTSRGISVYNQSFDMFENHIPPPLVQLLGIEVSGSKNLLPMKNPFKLTSDESNIVFHFKVISFLDENHMRFKAKLEGFDHQWSEELFPYNQVVRYRNLPPGKYRFHLKAKNALGKWSETVTSPRIIIRRPFYQQWWFYLLTILAVGILLNGIYQYLSQKKYSTSLAKEITERTRQLRASEEKYAKLFQEIRDIVYISSPEGRLIDMNPAGVKVFGFTSKEEILNANIAIDLYANPQDRNYFKKVIEEHGFVKDYELDVKRKDGEKFIVLLTSTEVRDEEGLLLAYLGIMRDITEKKKLERQLERAQKMEAIGMLAGGVAHDLNNILTGLTSYPELLLMQIPKNSSLKKPLQTIKQTGEKAAAMVQDLLTLSRRGVEVREVINLNEVIRDYLESPEFEKLKTYHPEAQIVVQMAQDLLNLLGSPIHLLKTFMNLISNAVEAMPHGGTVRIKTENQYMDTCVNGYDTIMEGEYVVLSVSDNGVGISPEDVSRIFEPFYTRKEMGRSGTGLGMSVVWATVKDHNGYIDIKTKKGSGTTFELYFPVTRNDMPRKISKTPIEKYMGNEKVLIIDDVEEQREVASGILAQLGYQVAAVSSGEEAIEYIKQHPVDILVIDMIMEKGIDGLETYRRIIHEIPSQKAIIVSGFSKTEKVKEMQRLGAGIYVKKPYTIEQFCSAIRRELDSHLPH